MDDFNEWVQYASFDFSGAQSLYEQKMPPSLVIFHCHECLEKTLKALCIKQKMALVKTHDIRMLFSDLIVSEKWLHEFKAGILDVHSYFGKCRYPGGDTVTRDDAMQCMVITETFFKKFQSLHP